MKTTIKYLLILICFSVKAQLQQETTTYSYDNLNRLVQVVFNNGSTHNYVYDDLGNRIQLDIDTTVLSIDAETLTNTITVYPNPTKSTINIKLPDSFKSKKTTIQLYDINGKLVSENKPIVTNNNIMIDVNSLSNGVYLLHLKSGKQKFSKLFIKK